MPSSSGQYVLWPSENLGQVFSAAMDLFLHLSGAEGVAFMLRDGEGAYRSYLFRGPLQGDISRYNFDLLVGGFSGDLRGRARVQAGRGFLICRGKETVVYLLGMPVTRRGQEMGIMVAASRRWAFTWESVDTLIHVITHLEKVIQTAELGECQFSFAKNGVPMDPPVSANNLKFSLDVRELLLSVAHLLAEVLSYDFCLLLLPEASGEYISCEVLETNPPGVDLGLKPFYPLQAGIYPLVYTRKTPFLSGDISKDRRFDDLGLRELATSLLAVPVMVGDEAMGVLMIGSRKAGHYHSRDLDTLGAFASQVGVLNKLAAHANFWEKYHHHIIESVLAAVISINLTGHIMTYNRVAEQLLEVLGKEIKGLHYQELLAKMEEKHAAPSLHKLQERIKQVLNTGRPYKKWGLQVSCRQKKDITVNLSLSPIRDSEERILGVTIVIEDITDKKRLEESLHEAEKLAALGELAVGMAHEIRNPLTAIKGFSQLLEYKNHSPREVAEYMQIMQAEVDKIGEIIHNLLLLSNSTRIKKESVDLHQLLESLFPLVQAEAALRDVEISYHPREGFPLLEADPEELKRAFLNIFLNALQAMPYGGVLTVKTVYRLREDELWIKVSDTGCGIEPEDYKRIFNPFFTTREEATGLGLSVAYQIIQRYGGNITLESRVEEGTTFTVKLPVGSVVFAEGRRTC